MGIKIKSFTISNLPAVSYNLFVYHYFNTETVKYVLTMICCKKNFKQNYLLSYLGILWQRSFVQKKAPAKKFQVLILWMQIFNSPRLLLGSISKKSGSKKIYCFHGLLKKKESTKLLHKNRGTRSLDSNITISIVRKAII